MKLQTAIKRKKEQLMKRAAAQGIYEDFGRKEVRELEDKYINISDYSPQMNANRAMLDNFAEWCSVYSPRKGNVRK